MHVAVVVADAHHAARVFEYGEQRKPEEAELAPMGMPRERQRYIAACRRVVDELRVMREQDGHGIRRDIRHRRIEKRRLLRRKSVTVRKGIIDACDIDAAPRHLSRTVQHDPHTPRARHRVYDAPPVVIVFVVADAVPNAVRIISDMCGKRLCRRLILTLIVEEITRHGEEIRAARGDLPEQLLKILHGKIGSQMHVADLRDDHALRLVRKARDGNRIVVLYRMQTFEERAISAEQQPYRRIGGSTREHPPPCGIIRRSEQSASQIPQCDARDDRRKRNPLRRKEQNDEKRDRRAPPVHECIANEEDQTADTEDVKRRDAETRKEQPPPRGEIAQEIQRRAEDQADRSDEDQSEYEQGRPFLHELRCR